MQVVSRQPSDAGPARIQPLSVLPVFLDLTGKRAVVAGGTDGAAWKAELLAAAGACVEVYAPAEELSDEMRRIVGLPSTVPPPLTPPLKGEGGIDCGAPRSESGNVSESPSPLRGGVRGGGNSGANAAMAGHITHHDQHWTPACLIGAAVALADAEDEAEAAAFEAAARDAGAACNVIDKPAFCHFQFGSIVNRSPVVVGISTSGAAPILGQAIRRRVETLLPATLADWAALARDLRNRVTETLAPGARRRAFWEKLAERAFGPAPDKAADAELRETMAQASTAGVGHVTFVGAGPGDAELLTIKAVRALQAADVILFDDLVSDDVLELARREAKRILVGKRAGRPSCKQHEINDMMVSLAKAGRRVVRLKSGDPMIFGRAGEEIAELARQGISYDAVPGITAGLAMASALGVSLTHRDHSKSVRFVTGHSKRGGLPEDIDWRAIADPSATTIFYMGGRTAGEIAARLIGQGMAETTPVVVTTSIGRSGQQMMSGSLSRLASMVASVGGSAPILIGIGSVFRQSHSAVATTEAPDRVLAKMAQL